MNSIVYDIWLSLAVTPDSETFPRLLSEFSDSESIYRASDKQISAIVDPRSKDKDKLLDKDLERAKDVYDFCKKRGVGILTYFNDAFPDSLRQIPTPPVLLYYRGILPDFKNSFFAAVVGTRFLSKYGRKNAYNIAYDLAKAGTTVISGMALGIDSVALAAALTAGGTTVAVIGSGIDVCYPIQHKNLAREIVKKGCVFTEYAPGTRPERYNFPRRNRIISGLSSATLVIEGNKRSGALHTARHAIKQERPVYALPGNVESRNSEASNILLKNGAKILTSADDIIRDFSENYSKVLNPFALTTERRPKLEDVLTRYSVSAVSSEDDIFMSYNPRRVTKERQSSNVPSIQATEAPRTESAEEKTPDPKGFDAKTLKIYKKIPMGEDCLIESLVDSEFNLRDVMKALLKLEMGRFVTMLPGERVARNL